MNAPHGDGPGTDAGRAAQERLQQEARATASALLDWLGTRVDRAGVPGGGAAPGGRPAQSPGPCTWCPVCALVAALRGEQPELTARLAEQASGLMTLLRLMVQAHQDPGHGHQHGHQHAWPTPGEHVPPPAAASPAPAPPAPPAPPGWPAEWGAWEEWGTATPSPSPSPSSSAGANGHGTGGDEPRHPAADIPAEPVEMTEPAEIPEPAATSSAGGVPGRRRPPTRRASPRSAAFRGLGVPGADGDTSPETSPDTTTPPAAPTPAETPPVPEPPARPARGARPATPPPASGPARPSVQRIAIRRPARPNGTAGPDGSASC